jgi:hypothetical protein
MEDKKIMSFENFKENLNSDYFGQLKKYMLKEKYCHVLVHLKYNTNSN